MLCGCYAVGGTGALHKMAPIMKKEAYVEILKEHFNLLAKNVKLGNKLIFEIEYEPKDTS